MMHARETANKTPLIFSQQYLEERKKSSYYNLIRSNLEMVSMGVISLELGALSFFNFAFFFLGSAFNYSYYGINSFFLFLTPAVVFAPASAMFAFYGLYQIYETYNAYITYKSYDNLVKSKNIDFSKLDENVKVNLELRSVVELTESKLKEKNALEISKIREDQKVYLDSLLGKFSRSNLLVGKSEGGYLTLLPYSTEYIQKKKAENNSEFRSKCTKSVMLASFAAYSAFASHMVFSNILLGYVNLVQLSFGLLFTASTIALTYFAAKNLYQGIMKHVENGIYKDIEKKVTLSEGKNANVKDLDLQTGYNTKIKEATKGDKKLEAEVMKSFVSYVMESRKQTGWAAGAA